jgi:hypothetical protein
MDLVKKVESILREVFPPPDRIVLEDDDGIIGAVTAARFAEMETIDRINLIWDTLDKGLTPEERRRVVLIVAVTPEEEIAHTS